MRNLGYTRLISKVLPTYSRNIKSLIWFKIFSIFTVQSRCKKTCQHSCDPTFDHYCTNTNHLALKAAWEGSRNVTIQCLFFLRRKYFYLIFLSFNDGLVLKNNFSLLRSTVATSQQPSTTITLMRLGYPNSNRICQKKLIFQTPN